MCNQSHAADAKQCDKHQQHFMFLVECFGYVKLCMFLSQPHFWCLHAGTQYMNELLLQQFAQ